MGIACGALVWGVAGFFGVHALFTLAPVLSLVMKLGGGLYLIALGMRYLRNGFRADPGLPMRETAGCGGASLRTGFMTSIANPQSALSTASLFAATLPPLPSLGLGLGAILVMAGIAIAWYALVACVLTLRPMAVLFARARRWIDRLAGLAFIGLGARLALQR